MEKGSRIKAKPDIPWSGYAERENNSSDPHTGNGNNPDLHGPHGDQEQREDEQSLDSPVATAPFRFIVSRLSFNQWLAPFQKALSCQIIYREPACLGY